MLGPDRNAIVYAPRQGVRDWIPRLLPWLFLLIGGAIMWALWPLLSGGIPSQQLMATALLGSYSAYAAWVGWRFVRGWRDRVNVCSFDGDLFSIKTASGDHREVRAADLLGTMSLSTGLGHCLVLITSDGHATIDCSVFTILGKKGKEPTRAFWSLHKALLKVSPQHFAVVKSSRQRRTDRVSLPRLVFEIDFYTRSADRAVIGLRDQLSKGLASV